MRTKLGASRGRTRAGVVVFAAVIAVASTLPSAAYPRPGRTEPISLTAAGALGNADSFRSSMSADGRFIAFHSAASDLVTGDTNGTLDVFVRDRVTGAVERVSVGSGGAQASGGSDSPSISADGRFIAFRSSATDLVTGDTNGALDVFVHDRETGSTRHVSVDTGGTQGDGGSIAPALSADGRLVGFSSAATNLVPGDTNAVPDVFVHDVQAGITQRVSVATGGVQAGGTSTSPSLSDDGRLVVFWSTAADLAPGDGNAAEDVFVHDRETGVTERVSVAADGREGDGGSFHPSVSGDGRHVAFWSNAANLVPGDTNGWPDVFVRDRATGATERVSVASTGVQGLGLGLSDYPSISADGRFVAFQSQAANLVPGDTNVSSDVFVHDRSTGSTERVSVAADGVQGDGHSYFPSIGADGRHVAFYSQASNLIPGGSAANRRQVYARDRGPAVGVGDVWGVKNENKVSVSGWAAFSGQEVAAAADPPNDGQLIGPLTAREAGAELTGASVTYRPEEEDLLVRLRLAGLPLSSSRTCVMGSCVFGNVGGGAPAIIYGLRLDVGEARYEVRALRAGATASTPSAPYFALYRCAPDCVEQVPLAGGIGTSGDDVRVSVTLAALGASEGTELREIEAFTAAGEAGPGAIHPLDSVDVAAATLPAARVWLGIAPVGTQEGDVTFDTGAALASGAFAGTLEASSLSEGEHEVWARACLGQVCGAASRPVFL
jgi:Tol biopolymer transport system component